EEAVAAELGRVLLLQPVADVVGLGGVVHHDEQDRLATQRGELVAVLLPAPDARSQVRLIARTGDLRLLLSDALGDALERTLDHAVEDGLLERVVVDGPGEELALGMSGGGSEVELSGNSPHPPPLSHSGTGGG